MDRAHKIAQERLPINEADRSLEHQNQIKREIFCNEYYAAEKDLALTWEDLGTIDDIIEQLANHSDLPLQGQEVFYQEVLRIFREMKNK